jgi:hypothetical protein
MSMKLYILLKFDSYLSQADSENIVELLHSVTGRIEAPDGLLKVNINPLLVMMQLQAVGHSIGQRFPKTTSRF